MTTSMERFKQLLRQREAELTHLTPDVAPNLAIFIATAAARDAIWQYKLLAHPIHVSDRQLVHEITRSLVSYLCG
jgi:hypothetical protein